MGLRAGIVFGLAAGYYLGAKAGRQRYDEINVLLRRLRGTSAVQSLMGQAQGAARDFGYDQARDMIGNEAAQRARDWVDRSSERPFDFDQDR